MHRPGWPGCWELWELRRQCQEALLPEAERQRQREVLPPRAGHRPSPRRLLHMDRAWESLAAWPQEASQDSLELPLELQAWQACRRLHRLSAGAPSGLSLNQ